MRLKKEGFKSLEFSKNFPDLLPEQPRSIILYDPVGAFLSAITSIFGSLFGETVLGITIGGYVYGASTGLLALALGLGASYALYALTSPGKPNIGAGGVPTSTMQTGILINGRNVSDPIKLCYGTLRTGKNHIFMG
jgi:hypothetical protein